MLGLNVLPRMPSYGTPQVAQTNQVSAAPQYWGHDPGDKSECLLLTSFSYINGDDDDHY